jgi:hypothetical protein
MELPNTKKLEAHRDLIHNETILAYVTSKISRCINKLC